VRTLTNGQNDFWLGAAAVAALAALLFVVGQAPNLLVGLLVLAADTVGWALLVVKGLRRPWLLAGGAATCFALVLVGILILLVTGA
jgi:hypothetical protein